MIRLDSHRRRLDPRPPHKAPCLVDCEFGNYWEVGCIWTNFGNSDVFWWIDTRVTHCVCTRTCILDQTESSKPGCTWKATFEQHLTWGKPTKSWSGRTVTAGKGFQNDEDYMRCPPPMFPQRHWDLFQNDRVLRIWKYYHHWQYQDIIIIQALSSLDIISSSLIISKYRIYPSAHFAKRPCIIAAKSQWTKTRVIESGLWTCCWYWWWWWPWSCC